MDLVSVIVPIYNVEKYLERCIASIVKQTYENMEIILVDDGSTDGGGSICDGWGEKDSRITVIHKKNGGLSDARNAGLDRAVGDYILFVDSDDYIDPDLIRYCLDTLKANHADMVVYGYHRVSDACNSLLECDGDRPEEEKVLKRELTDLCFRTDRISVAVWNKFYKRKIWDHLRFPTGRIAEDNFVILDVLMNAENAVISDKKLYYYRKRPGSITDAEGKKLAYDSLEACRQRCKRVKKNSRLYKLSLAAYTSQLMGVYELESKWNKKKLLKQFRRIYRFPIRNVPWKMAVLQILFFIHPCIYEWFFVKHREELRALEGKLHIKYVEIL